MATLKLKNATAGIYVFNFRSPVSNKMVSKVIEPMSTIEVFSGDVDQCSMIRLQATNLPDNDEARIDECPIQFIWEGVLPSVDDYQGALLSGEKMASDSATADLTQTVNETAEPMTEESNLTVQRAGTKKGVTAQGTQG